jgi:hypothetical protein
MKRNIKPFVSNISHLFEDESNQMSDTRREQIIRNIDKELMNALKRFTDQKAFIQKKIKETEQELERQIKLMRDKFDESIARLEELGVKFENGVLVLNEVTLYLREGEKIMEYTNEEKVKMFDIISRIDKNFYAIITTTATAYDIVDDKVATIRQISPSLRPDKQGYMKPGARLGFSDTEIQEALASVNESIFRNAINFFKNLFSRNEEEIEKIEEKIENFEDLAFELKKIVFNR